MHRIAVSALLSSVLLAPLRLQGTEDPPKKAVLPLVFRDDFSKGADAWQPTDPAAWKVIQTGKGMAYSQFRQSKYNPPHRSPFNLSLVKDVQVGDFVLDAQVQSTARDYPHRDVCLCFGYQDPAHFYYVHLGKKTDDHCNQIFIVNGSPRVKISTKTTAGTNWDDGWHHVRIVRTIADGQIAVYFDDMKTPAMTATDKTFTGGRVGIGSFDDTSNWTDFRLRGVKIRASGPNSPLPFGGEGWG
jgi:hypothetical protein